MFAWVAALLAVGAGRGAGTALSGKPPVEEYAQVSRWLVHEASWGTLSTRSVHLRGAPYGRACAAHAQQGPSLGSA